MRVSTVSLGRNCVQLYLLNYTLPPYMKVEPIIVQYTTVQIMEQLMYTRAPRQHYIERGQVLEIYKDRPVSVALLHTKETIML